MADRPDREECGERGGFKKEKKGNNQASEVISVGQGEVIFRFEATDNNGTITAWDVSTDKKFVGEALIEVNLIGGNESDYGFYVTAVNGSTADYDTDKSYWAFYINGEYAMSGVGTTEIDETHIYSFVYTKD
jgi:hypothetical protein